MIFEAALTTSSTAIVVKDPYLKPYHAARLTVPQLERVKPSSWTVVTADDRLMRNVLAASFLQEYSWYTVFQPDYFFDDMADVDEDNF